MTTLADLLAEPEGVALDPGIYAQPKDRDPASEDSRQAAFIATVRRLYPHVMVWAVPNGGKRSQWAAQKAKREGMVSGVADTCVAWAGGVAWVEFKNGQAGVDTKANDNQVRWLNGMHKRGHLVAVCRTAAGATAWLKERGCPIA